jgi:hypothetical protein
MATYFWVGRTTGATSTTQDKVDQYCFNAPGNWLIKTNDNQLIGTTATPAYGDMFFIGGGVSLFGAVNYPGYTFAKSPCLYGGFSGNVALGTWSHTSTVSTGTTFTTAANDAYLGSFGYPFPWLGGGISGDILRWCAYRDGVSLAGATAFYTAANSSGFRNPSQNLKLKIGGNINIYNDRYLQPSTYDATGTPELHTQNTKFIVDIEPIRAHRTGSPIVGNEVDFDKVHTRLFVFASRSGGVRIRGGRFYSMQLCTLTYNSSVGVDRSIPTFPEYLYDAGIEIYDTISLLVTSSGWNRQLHTNCVYAHMLHKQIDRGVTYFGYGVPGPFGTQMPIIRATTTQTLDFNNSSINAFIPFDDLYGINGSAIDGIRDLYYGTLVLVPQASNIEDNNSNVPESDTAWYSLNREWTANDGEIYPSRTRDEIRNTVSPVRLGGNTGTCRITRIEMKPEAERSAYIPVSVQIAGDVDIGTIDLTQRSRLEAADDISPNAIARIGEVRLYKRGMVDFGTRGSHFRNWYIGGLSGGSGAQEGVAYGGILFMDDFGGTQVRGGPYSIYWATQTEGGVGFNDNVRQPLVDIPEASLPEPLE